MAKLSIRYDKFFNNDRNIAKQDRLMKKKANKKRAKKKKKAVPWERDKDLFLSTFSPATHCFQLKAPAKKNKARKNSCPIYKRKVFRRRQPFHKAGNCHLRYTNLASVRPPQDFCEDS